MKYVKYVKHPTLTPNAGRSRSPSPRGGRSRRRRAPSPQPGRRRQQSKGPDDTGPTPSEIKPDSDIQIESSNKATDDKKTGQTDSVQIQIMSSNITADEIVKIIEEGAGQFAVKDSKRNMLLLIGAVGTGKTEAIKQAAYRLKAEHRMYTVANIKDKMVGGTAKNIAAMFNDAIETSSTTEKYVIVQVDEIDDLVSKTGLDSESANSSDHDIRSMLLHHIQELEHVKGVVFCATTNYPWNLEAALARRFQLIYVTMPSEDERYDVVAHVLKPYKLSHEVLDLSAKLSEKMTHSEVKDMCMKACKSAREREEGDPTPEKEDFVKAEQITKRFVSQEYLQKLAAYKRNGPLPSKKKDKKDDKSNQVVSQAACTVVCQIVLILIVLFAVCIFFARTTKNNPWDNGL